MCTSLFITDTSGAIYVGRTLEFAGVFPWQLSYYPKGLKFTSTITVDQDQATVSQSGISYQNTHAFIGMTLSTSNSNTYQDLQVIHGLNDAGLNFGANSFYSTQGPAIEQDKIPSALAASDLGTWALGQFSTVAEVKAALTGQLVYCTPLPALNSDTTPLNYAFYDRTGAAIVIEYYQGQQCIYDNSIGVMTNGPVFSWHLTNLNNYTNLSNIDCNQVTFNSLQLNQPDSGIATTIIPGSSTSPGRFIKAVYYSQFALKAKTADEAVIMLGHVMNNFDRPLNITINPSTTSSSSSEGAGSSEFTVWTALSDLNRLKFFVRSSLEMNYQQFDLDELSILNSFKTIPYMSKYQGLASSDSQALINT